MPQSPGPSQSIISPPSPGSHATLLPLLTHTECSAPQETWKSKTGYEEYVKTPQDRTQDSSCSHPSGVSSTAELHLDQLHASLRSRAVPGKSAQGKQHLCAASPEKGGDMGTGQATASPLHRFPAAPLGKGPEPEGLRGTFYQRGEDKQGLAGTLARNSSLKINEH